jgi:arylsulfatase A-like enzyme
MRKPNVLVIMTDEERYPPPYETADVAAFRAAKLPNRARVRDGGLELHRHYVGSMACVPSRATMFTGQYPSLHLVSQTDGVAKHADDPGMQWLDPTGVPTLGDWFRAGGYQSHYRGKWHVSHADLIGPDGVEGLAASDDDGRVLPDVVAQYLAADRLDPFGFSGWIGREPHGVAKSNAGAIRDPVIAEQVRDLFDSLAATQNDAPWLAVASLVNPHDIAFAGGFYEMLLGLEVSPDVPDIAPAPSQADSFAGRPAVQKLFTDLWPKMVANQPPDEAYRRLYFHLHQLVDVAIGRILDGLDASGMADDTVVVLTSDHGDLLGAHGGMVQKWANAFDEATRVPMVIRGPGIAATPEGVSAPTSHIDVIPTLLGLAGIDVEAAATELRRTHTEVRPLPGRDLSEVVQGRATLASAPVYFMTEDDVTSGQTPVNVLTGEEFAPIHAPACIESVVAELPTGPDGTSELWKLNHYYDHLDGWPMTRPPSMAGDRSAPEFELHNLSRDPEERTNLASSDASAFASMGAILAAERDAKRLLPTGQHHD